MGYIMTTCEKHVPHALLLAAKSSASGVDVMTHGPAIHEDTH